MKRIRINIPGFIERNNMVTALAFSGKKVWVEEVNTGVLLLDHNYLVCFEVADGEVSEETNDQATN